MFIFQLVVGNYGLSPSQERVQFGMWSMIASPLLMSVDVRTILDESRLLLQNKRVLSISQDPLGIQATRIVNVSISVCRNIYQLESLILPQYDLHVKFESSRTIYIS